MHLQFLVSTTELDPSEVAPHESPCSTGTGPRPLFPPKRDPTCPSCTAPAKAPYWFDKTLDTYENGEILAINESVHAPVEQRVFPGRLAGTKQRSERKGRRPCIVLRERQIELGKDKTYTVLMTGYSGIYKMEGLPSVLQHFCLPVSPHREIGVGVEHLHTTPEWQKTHIWLIALPFSSLGAVGGRWKWKKEDGVQSEDCSFTVGQGMVSQVAQIQRRKWAEWSAKCSADGRYLEATCEEYKIFKLQGDRRRAHGDGITADKASLDTWITHQTNIENQVVPSGRFVFGNAPWLDLVGGEDVGFLPDIESQLRTLSPLVYSPEEPAHMTQRNLDVSALSTEMIGSGTRTGDIKRADLDDTMLKLPQDTGSATTENNRTTYGDGSQGPIPQHGVATSARANEDAKGPEVSVVGKPAKRSRKKWSKLFSLGDIRRNPK